VYFNECLMSLASTYCGYTSLMRNIFLCEEISPQAHSIGDSKGDSKTRVHILIY
jgi:hypothetical protein